MQQTRKNKIARPAARKSSGGRTKPNKSATPRARKPEPTAQAPAHASNEPQNPRRRFVELPKVPGELPTPTATFYF